MPQELCSCKYKAGEGIPVNDIRNPICQKCGGRVVITMPQETVRNILRYLSCDSVEIDQAIASLAQAIRGRKKPRLFYPDRYNIPTDVYNCVVEDIAKFVEEK
jgi:hypothetical protein